MSEALTSCAPQFTLGEVVDTYLMQRGVQNKKYYPSYLYAGFRAWKDIFQKVMWVTSSKWMPLKKGEPYDYIEMPSGLVRFFSVNTVDECGNIVSLYYNPQLNVIPEPTESTCGCGDCGCAGGVCDDINSTIMTEEVEFTINGVDYKKKKWVKYCKNGDVIEYTETPTKKWNDYHGNGGDFNNDYNNDYDIGQSGAFENYTIVYVTEQKIICKLKVRPCGCPENTEENATAVSNACGCYINPCRKKRCYPIYQDVNSNHYGEVKISDCGTRIYYKPPPKLRCLVNNTLPTHLQVAYQVSGAEVSKDIIVPDGVQTTVWSGIDFYTKIYNNKYSLYEKNEAERRWEKDKIELILYFNPIKISFLQSVQDTVIRW